MKHVLRNSVIYRGGVTARYLENSGEKLSVYDNQKKERLEISFSIPSKGGGDTVLKYAYQIKTFIS